MTDRPLPGAQYGGSVLRAALALLAIAVFCAPFAAVWQYRSHRQAVEHQAALADAVPDTAAGLRSAAGRLPDPAGPVVLAYHDIRPDGRKPYTLTPERFGSHLEALRAAGYRTLSTAEFVRHLGGGTVPGRSVYLTFDDGGQGLWRHADAILAEHGMRAAVYLITGQVGERHSYYLSWEEVRRMARSGRWDFQSHTRDLHRRLPVDAGGRTAPALAHRLWLPAEQRRESPAEYRDRVAGDLDGSIADIESHGLPRPLSFAYPFSESAADGDAAATGDLPRLLRDRFRATLTNDASRPLGAGVRAAAHGTVQRLEVTSSTTAAELLNRLAAWTPRRPGAEPRPLDSPTGWVFPAAPAGTGVGAFTGKGSYPWRRGYLVAAYQPMGSADWSDYSVRTRVTALSGTRSSVALTVRAHSLWPVSVSLGHGQVRITEGGGAGKRMIRRGLDPAASHRLRVVVGAHRTDVFVDGERKATVRVPRSAAPGQTCGGIRLGVRNEGAERWPAFDRLTVSPLAGPGHRGGVRPPPQRREAR